MAFIYRKDEKQRNEKAVDFTLGAEETTRPLWKNGLYFLTLVFILIFAAWGKPAQHARHPQRDGNEENADIRRFGCDDGNNHREIYVGVREIKSSGYQITLIFASH